MEVRRCKHCLATIPSGRCPCRSVRPRYKKAQQGSLEAAHFYHLIKSIRSGSWANTGYIPAHNPERDANRALYQHFGASGFSISRARSPFTDFKSIQFFVFRCELAAEYWRDQFAQLMGTRMTLWLGGCDQQKTADFLQLPLEKLRYLDDVIRTEYKVRFPFRNRLQHTDFLKARRRMKSGVAADIVRRKEYAYKQAQVLPPQQVSPFS